MNRLTDDRFVGDGFYQPKSREERKELATMELPSYRELYNRLAEYEKTGFTPEEIENLTYKYGVRRCSNFIPKESKPEIKDGTE